MTTRAIFVEMWTTTLTDLPWGRLHDALAATPIAEDDPNPVTPHDLAFVEPAQRKLGSALFDTNVLRDVQRGRITPAQVELARGRLAQDAAGRGFFSPISLLELGSHLDSCRDSPREFARYQGALRAIERLGLHALPDPGASLAMAAPLSGARAAADDHPASPVALSAPWTARCAALLASARSYDELVFGQRVAWGGKRQRVRFVPGVFRSVRADGEALFVKKLDYIRTRIATATGLAETITSEASWGAFLEAATAEVATPPARDPPHHHGALSPLFSAWSAILTRTATASYDGWASRNDHHDLGLLAHLAEPSLTLVTNDRGFIDKLGETARVLTFDAWLDRAPSRSNARS